jgi:hypothetical protein
MLAELKSNLLVDYLHGISLFLDNARAHPLNRIELDEYLFKNLDDLRQAVY